MKVNALTLLSHSFSVSFFISLCFVTLSLSLSLFHAQTHTDTHTHTLPISLSLSPHPTLPSSAQVLIFSQMVKMIDLIEEFCEYRQYSCERLDGRVSGNDRQKVRLFLSSNPLPSFPFRYLTLSDEITHHLILEFFFQHFTHLLPFLASPSFPFSSSPFLPSLPFPPSISLPPSLPPSLRLLIDITRMRTVSSSSYPLEQEVSV